jgi:hypothetical protein
LFGYIVGSVELQHNRALDASGARHRQGADACSPLGTHDWELGAKNTLCYQRRACTSLSQRSSAAVSIHILSHTIIGHSWWFVDGLTDFPADLVEVASAMKTTCTSRHLSSLFLRLDQLSWVRCDQCLHSPPHWGNLA